MHIMVSYWAHSSDGQISFWQRRQTKSPPAPAATAQHGNMQRQNYTYTTYGTFIRTRADVLAI